MDRLERYRTAWSRYCKSRGYGIHSPFAYNFVLNVINEQHPYYAYDDIENLYDNITEMVKQEQLSSGVMSQKNAKLVFRVVNHFNPAVILQIGSSYGMSTICALMPNSKSEIYLYEPDFDNRTVLQKALEPYRNRIVFKESIVQAVADYDAAVIDNNQQHFVIVNDIPADTDYNQLQVAIYSIIDKQGVVLFRNIAKSELMLQLWNDSKEYAQSGMSFSNERIAVFVANPKLPRQDFLLWL